MAETETKTDLSIPEVPVIWTRLGWGCFWIGQGVLILSILTLAFDDGIFLPSHERCSLIIFVFLYQCSSLQRSAHGTRQMGSENVPRQSVTNWTS